MSKAKNIRNKKIVYILFFFLILGFIGFNNFKELSFTSLFNNFKKQNDLKLTQTNQEGNFIISLNHEDLIENQKTISAEEAGEIF